MVSICYYSISFSFHTSHNVHNDYLYIARLLFNFLVIKIIFATYFDSKEIFFRMYISSL